MSVSMQSEIVYSNLRKAASFHTACRCKGNKFAMHPRRRCVAAARRQQARGTPLGRTDTACIVASNAFLELRHPIPFPCRLPHCRQNLLVQLELPTEGVSHAQERSYTQET